MAQSFSLWQFVLDCFWLLFLFMVLKTYLIAWLESKQTQNWVKTTGWITHWDLIRDEKRLWPEIEYVYEVNGEEYTGHHLFPDTEHNSPVSHYARGIAYKAAMSFEKNQAIEIYYDPFFPKRSALDIRIPKKIYIVLALLLLLILFHAGFMAYRLWF